MKIKLKHSFILIEIVIALTLGGVLLSFLWKSFLDATKMNHVLRPLKEKLYLRHLTYVRLQTIFDHLEEPSSFPNFGSKCPIYTEKESTLRFIFDNGIDYPPEFSGESLGELSMDKGNLNLLITTKTDQKRKELSYPGVQEVSWSFFDAKEKKWYVEWNKEQEEKPLILKLMIKEKKLAQPHIYYFFLNKPKIIFEDAL